MIETKATSLTTLLYGSGLPLYAILDGASVPELLDKLYEFGPKFECLYRGELAPDLAEVAPYLVVLEPRTQFAEWVIRSGWGQHWGVFVAASPDLAAMRHHFRRFLTVHTEEGQPLYFRYYDPRVLRIYLPTCNAEELETVFGPVHEYLLEGESPETLVRFRKSAGTLVTDEFPVSV
jgi:hypothetical protein